MLSIVLKNSILISLTVLIAHFLIKNKMMEGYEGFENYARVPNNSEFNKYKSMRQVDERKVKNDNVIDVQKHLDNLYQYIYANECAAGDLKKQYEPQVKTASPPVDITPISIAIQQNAKKPLLDNTASSGMSNKYTKYGVMFNEYANESGLNGGALYEGNVRGFNSYDDNYLMITAE